MRENALLQSLPEEELTKLRPYLRTVELKAGQPLLEIGEPIEAVWFPHDCVTSTVVDTREGTTIEVGLMGMEGLVGVSLLLGGSVSNSTVIAQVSGTATRMSAEDFKAQIVEPRGEPFFRLLQYVDAFMAMVAQTAACNSLHGIDERLARWILMTRDRVGRDDLALTHEFLAYMLGVRRASVSIAALGLAQMGFIKYSRGHLMILDRSGLESAACACYSVVRHITEQLYKSREAA